MSAGKKTISHDSSAAWMWGVLLLADGKWTTAGFFKTERAAKQFALSTGRDVFLIARRYQAREAANSRNMPA